jgi:hypothetical protein
MPYIPKFKVLFKILFRRQDPQAAEAIWLEGTWLHDQGDAAGARDAFHHARLLDRHFGGAFYNYAALTEKLKGPGAEAIEAWEAYLAAAAHDKRQAAAVVDKVREHLGAMKARGK